MDESMLDLIEVLISRSGNRFLINDEIRSISFFILEGNNPEFYFVNPLRLGAGYQRIAISQQGIAALILNPTTMLCRNDTIKVPKFYW